MNALIGGIVYRVLKEGDIPMACDLLRATNASIDGMMSPAVYRAVCRDSIARRNAVVVISLKDGTLAGCTVALIDRKAYWRSFLLWHPALTFYVITRALAMKLRVASASDKRSVQSVYDYGGKISDKPSGRTWQESSPFIAKILHTGVTDESRGMGIAKRLHEHLMVILAGRGVKRVDGNSSLGNMPSVKLLLSTGFTIEKAPSNLFATRDI